MRKHRTRKRFGPSRNDGERILLRRRRTRPGQALAAIGRANGRILVSNDYFTIARSDDEGFVARLYAAGALLVLDAEQAGGCTGLPPAGAASSWRSPGRRAALPDDRFGPA